MVNVTKYRKIFVGSNKRGTKENVTGFGRTAGKTGLSASEVEESAGHGIIPYYHQRVVPVLPGLEQEDGHGTGEQAAAGVYGCQPQLISRGG